MRKLILILVVLLFLPYTAPATELLWPPPPEKARIKFLQTVSTPADLKIKKSFFKRVWEFIAGAETERLERPFSIAIQGDKICVTDMALGGLHIFDLRKNNYRIVFPKQVKLIAPVGVAFTKDGSLLVADSALKKIFRFDGEGKLLSEFTVGFPFQRPTALAVSASDGAVWVVDTLANQIVKFNPKGEKILSFGKRGTGKGEFNYPTGIKVGNNGKVYVCDTLNARLQIFSADGNFISAFGRHGDSTGDFASPKSTALDSEGNIYVVDGLFDAVQVFNEKGQLLLVFGQRGTKNGEFYVPAAVFVDETDRIFITDSYNGRIQIFQYLREF